MFVRVRLVRVRFRVILVMDWFVSDYFSYG